MNMPLPLISPLMTVIIISAALFFAGAIIGFLIIRYRLPKRWKIVLLIPPTVFVLYILFYLACNFVGRMQVKAQFAKMRSLGIATDVNEIIPKNRESAENGALLYEAAYKIETGTDDCEKIYDLSYERSYDVDLLDDKGKSIIAAFMKTENAGMIFRLLKEGTKKPFATYNYYYNGIETQLSSISRQRSIFRLVSFKSSYDALSGKKEEAYDLINDGFKMLKQLECNMFLISHLVNIACYSINCDRLNDLLEKYGIDNADACKLLNTLNVTDLKKGAVKALEGDINCFGVDAFTKVIRGYPIFDNEITLRERIMLKLNPFFYQDYACYLNHMISVIELGKEPAWISKKKIDDMDSELRHKCFVPITQMGAFSVGVVYTKTAQCETNINATKIALALHIYKNNHGQFPETLDALAPEILKEIPFDLTDGKPFEYKKTDKYFSLSSKWLAEKAKRDAAQKK